MNKNTILIVEDDEDIRDVLKEALEMEGYPIETVSDGRAALERLAIKPSPSLILLDLMLPHVTGWQVLDEIKKTGSHPAAKIPVIIASAAGESSPPIQYPVEGYLKKPIHLDDLLNIVQKNYRA